MLGEERGGGKDLQGGAGRGGGGGGGRGGEDLREERVEVLGGGRGERCSKKGGNGGKGGKRGGGWWQGRMGPMRRRAFLAFEHRFMLHAHALTRTPKLYPHMVLQR